jgi:hypothetical protein
MLLPYGFILWIPTIASLLLYVALWNVNELLGWTPAVYATWFLGALGMQYFFSNIWWFWLTGLLAQVALAFLLSIKWRLSG